MRKIVAIVVAVLMSAPTEMLAQGFTATTTPHGPLLTAALAEASRLEGSLSGGAAMQSSPVPGWDQLQSLPAGTRVRLSLLNGAEIEGRLVQATPDAVVLADNQLRKGQFTTPAGTSLRDERTFLETDVARVQTETYAWFGRHPVMARTLIGAGVGFGAGFVGGATSCPGDADFTCSFVALAFGGLGAGVGAAVGNIIGWVGVWRRD